MEVNAGINAIYIWPDSALYIGTNLYPQAHSHSAIECAIPLTGSLRLRQGESDNWQFGSAAIIDGEHMHHLSTPGEKLASLYLEKTDQHYRQLLSNHNVSPGGATLLDAEIPDTLRQTLCDSLFIPFESGQANAVRQALLEYLQTHEAKNSPLEPRLEQVIRQIQASPDHKWSSGELAAIACLSPSRLQHLFKQHMGMPIRRYLLWHRTRLAIAGLLQGRGLADTAQAAGFSDSPHFSRTCKAILGISPSMLLQPRNNLNVVFCRHTQGPYAETCSHY